MLNNDKSDDDNDNSKKLKTRNRRSVNLKMCF